MTDYPKLGDRQMWDSEKGEWVPFDVGGAHFIINVRKEGLCLRIYRQFDPMMKGWQTTDSSYLSDKLKENKTEDENNTPFPSFTGYQDFYEMVKQDRQEYENEGRMNEYDNNRCRRLI